MKGNEESGPGKSTYRESGEGDKDNIFLVIVVVDGAFQKLYNSTLWMV